MTPDALTDSLTRSWAHGEHAELAGASFDAPVVLDDKVLRSFDLTGARFGAGLSAQRAVFRGMAWLHRAEVTGKVDLSDAVFRSDLRMDGLVCDTLILSGAEFQGVLTLDRARIGTLIARDCICLANLSLAGARITGHADFSGSEVLGGAWADGAELHALEQVGMVVDGRRTGL